MHAVAWYTADKRCAGMNNMHKEEIEQCDPSLLRKLRKYIKYEYKMTRNSHLEKCLYELHLNIIQAMVTKKKIEKKIVVLRLRRLAIFAVTLTIGMLGMLIV